MPSSGQMEAWWWTARVTAGRTPGLARARCLIKVLAAEGGTAVRAEPAPAASRVERTMDQPLNRRISAALAAATSRARVTKTFPKVAALSASESAVRLPWTVELLQTATT